MTGAMVTFVSFVLFGAVPLLTYVLALLLPPLLPPLLWHALPGLDSAAAVVSSDWWRLTLGTDYIFTWTVLLTACTSFALGCVRAQFTGTRAITSGLQTLTMSAAASAVAYAVGFLLRGFCADF